MDVAKPGDRVRVHYTGRLEDGTVFSSSRGGAPLEFTLGERQVIEGLEGAVEGMSPGETRTAWVPPELGHGQRRDDLLMVVERYRFPPDLEPQVGQQLRMRREGHSPALVTVAATAGEVVVLDGNHPLAGRELTFELELVEIDPRMS